MDSDWSWRTPEERRVHVVVQHDQGRQITAIALTLGVDVKTIRRDCEHLGLETWSNLSDTDLNALVLQIIGMEHTSVGLAKIESHLIELGHRVQQTRIRASLMSLSYARAPPRRVKRRKYYATHGPDFVWVMDQNEKVGMFGFKILTAIDGFSRHPVFWMVVTNLRGTTHSRLFTEAVRFHGGAPQHVSVDGAEAWNGVEHQIAHIYGDSSEMTLLEIDGEYAGVRRFNQTSSVHQGPVERHWGDVNLATRKWKEVFRMLEALGFVDITVAGDLFSLVSVFKEAFVKDVDAHYHAMMHRKKKRDTVNPDYPAGTHRRWELYKMMEPSLKTCLGPAEVESVAAAADEYWSASSSDDAPHASEVDPLPTPALRAARAAALDFLRPLSLTEEYVAHRSFTMSLAGFSGRPAAFQAATSAASEAVRELGVRMASSRFFV